MRHPTILLLLGVAACGDDPEGSSDATSTSTTDASTATDTSNTDASEATVAADVELDVVTTFELAVGTASVSSYDRSGAPSPGCP